MCSQRTLFLPIPSSIVSGFIVLAELDLLMMRNRLDLLTELRDGWNEIGASGPS